MNTKKFLCSLLCVSMIISGLGITAYAEDDNRLAEIAIDSALISRGVPQTILNEMPIEVKSIIYEDESLYFKGASGVLYDQEAHSFEDYTISNDGIMPLGQIPTADLTLNFSFWGSFTSSSTIKVFFHYDWKNLPVFRWQDPMAVSWNDELFEMPPQTFYKVDKFDGYKLDPSSVDVYYPVTGEIHSEENGYADASPAGVTWYADLKGYGSGIKIKKLYGYGYFSLEKITSASGSSILYGHYVHPTVSTTPYINIGDYGTFSVSGGSNYDERGSSVRIDY